MKSALNIVLIITVILVVVNGLGFVLAPATMLGLTGVKLDTAGVYVTRLFGTANIGAGLLIFFARGADAPDIGRRLAMGALGWIVVEVIVLLLGQFSGVTNSMGWTFIGLDLLLILAYAFLLFAVPARAPRATPGQA